jgi:hypothetical protein
MPDASNADPNNPEQNLPVENPADPELLSDDDAIDILRALSGECFYCKETMSNSRGCDGCRPIRTREFVEGDSDLAEFLGDYHGYHGDISCCLGYPYDSHTCGEFADYLEEIADESDEDEVRFSPERIEEIRDGGELSPEEMDVYRQSQEGRSFLLPALAFVSIEDERGEYLYFVVDLEFQGKGYSWESASGPYTAEEYEKLRASYEADEWWSS